MAWFENWFGSPYYPILYRHRDNEEAEKFIRNVCEELKLAIGSKVLDLACGRGRHARFLHALHYNVQGWDISPESIADANTSIKEGLSFKVHDMRLPFPDKDFDVIFNLFTSFGYFDDFADNEKVIVNIKNALKKEGTLVLDFMNPSYVIEHLVYKEEKNIDGVIFNIERKVEDGYIKKFINIKDTDVQKLYTEKVQIINNDDFEKLFSRFGLKIKKIWGSYDGNDYNEKNSQRMIFFVN